MSYKTTGLTPILKKYLNYSAEYIKEHKMSPTFTEIAEHFETAPANVTPKMQKLKALGYVEYDPNQNRTLSLTRKAAEIVEEEN